MILHGREMGAGAGAPLVLLHGLFGQAANFAAVQRHLARRVRVIALDLRNHGASGHDARMDYAAMAEDVLATLHARHALPAIVFGHSMGGKVAMQVALMAPAAVSRLAVGDIAPVVYAPAFRAVAAAMQAVPLRPGLTRAEAEAVLAETVADARVRAFLLQSLSLVPVPAWRLNLPAIAAALPQIEGWETPPGAPGFAGPTLFIAGARSDYIRPEYRPAIRALFPAARVVTLKNAGHWLHADNPAGFVAVLEAFAAPVSPSA
jgi:pimeloyl-ACP methyl ester carboxylesterase